MLWFSGVPVTHQRLTQLRRSAMSAVCTRHSQDTFTVSRIIYTKIRPNKTGVLTLKTQPLFYQNNPTASPIYSQTTHLLQKGAIKKYRLFPILQQSIAITEYSQSDCSTAGSPPDGSLPTI